MTKDKSRKKLTKAEDKAVRKGVRKAAKAVRKSLRHDDKLERKRRKRVRREPEEARALLLAAALELVVERGPDRLTLVSVAKRAGVSHGLVTHYFGGIDNLLETALAKLIEERRSALLEALPESLAAGTPDLVLSKWFEISADPAFGRLLAWAILSGRAGSANFAPAVLGSGKVFADILEKLLTDNGSAPDRERLEVCILIAICAGLGYGISRNAMWRGFEREPTEERDRDFRDAIARLFESELGAPAPTDAAP